MEEYALYNRILSSDYLSDNQKILKDVKSKQMATIKANNIEYALYRFDLDESDFLRFFNNKHNDNGKIVDNPTPKGLRMFCDYVLLANHNAKLYVILIEMKSGKDKAKAKLQLDASADFMDFVKNNALRIKDMCDYHDFDGTKVVLKKVVLIPSPKQRPSTQPGKNSIIDWQATPVMLRHGVIPLIQLCK